MHARRGMDTALAAAIAPATVQLACAGSRESPGTAPRSGHYRYHYFKSLVKSRRGNLERARASLRAAATIALRLSTTILRASGEPRAPCARTKIRGCRPHFRSHPLARFWIVGESISGSGLLRGSGARVAPR
jgi:hypothetical protein